MKLEVITPTQMIFTGDVKLITFPGTMGLFTILPGHAPMISTLKQGELYFEEENLNLHRFHVSGGVAEIKNNTVIVCIDHII